MKILDKIFGSTKAAPEPEKIPMKRVVPTNQELRDRAGYMTTHPVNCKERCLGCQNFEAETSSSSARCKAMCVRVSPHGVCNNWTEIPVKAPRLKSREENRHNNALLKEAADTRKRAQLRRVEMEHKLFRRLVKAEIGHEKYIDLCMASETAAAQLIADAMEAGSEHT